MCTNIWVVCRKYDNIAASKVNTVLALEILYFSFLSRPWLDCKVFEGGHCNYLLSISSVPFRTHILGTENIFLKFFLKKFIDLKERDRFFCFTYLYIHCWILLCSLSGEWTCKLGELGQPSNHLSSWARAENVFLT